MATVPFINDDFMLTGKTARRLYHEYAEKLPIIDYHCHLDPAQIAENHSFEDITELWLGGDHYKWRALRANGVDEDYITGNRSPWEKFLKWAETVPYTMRNPLYHWTHLELARVFGIYELLSPSTARSIFDRCNEMLRSPEFRAQALVERFNVETVCTTDDPADSLEHHKALKNSSFKVKVLPAWRPDKAVGIDAPSYVAYIGRLSEASGVGIRSYESLVEALSLRHSFFESMGASLSDHGMEHFPLFESTPEEADKTLRKALVGVAPSPREAEGFKGRLLHDLAVMDADAGWVQQFHLGPVRNLNSAMYSRLGPDLGFDSIGDAPQISAGARFLDSLSSEGKLAPTILYNLNPKDTEALAALAFTFNDGSIPGKIQYGAAWWFLDQEDGMRRQLDALSSLGLLSRFVGMLTDSRSFISYPRHEYFRRILCDVVGADVDKGKLPEEAFEFIGKMISGISYYNAKAYFKF